MIWVTVIVGLTLLVILHELGHFGVALLVGMKPRSFYIGFPPAIAKVKWKGIEFGIGSIPLGGLVRIPGMHRPAGADVEAWMSTALHEEPSLAPFVQRVRRDLDAGDLSAARDHLPELQQHVEAARSRSARAGRSASRATGSGGSSRRRRS